MRSTLLLILIIICSNVYSQSTEELVDSSNSFIETLGEENRTKLMYKFNDSLRTNWSNLPAGMVERPGLRIGDLSDPSKVKLHELLLTIFSSQGYLKTTSIMMLDDIVNSDIVEEAIKKEIIVIERLQQIKELNWDYDNYFLSLWGKPEIKSPWGLKFEGHHLSINLTIDDEDISFTPMFIGVSPATIPFSKYTGLKILSKEEDYGFKLINLLDQNQKEVATISIEVPKDIITNPKYSGRITEYQGIKGEKLNSIQKKTLINLIKEYVNNLEHDKAEEVMLRIEKSGIDNIYFAWIGSYKKREPHYYIINGPDFIIEYDNYGGIDGKGNHIHTIWREKSNDFGEDILKKHHLNHKH